MRSVQPVVIASLPGHAVQVNELPKKTIDALLNTPYGEAAYAVCEKLFDAGYEAWWVGGVTRDIALGIPPSDIDIATSATPENVKALFRDAQEDVRGLASVVVQQGRFTFDVTTFRAEGDSSNARHPANVVFTSREKDAERRDFTVNAIYYQPISRITFDPTGGLADAKERLVRFIGEPSERVQHDALRIVRAVRLRALIGGQYHPATYTALRANAALVATLSGARQLEEIEKILAGPHGARAFEDLWEVGILQHMVPELYACKGVAQPADYHHEGDVWEHLLACVSAFRTDDDADVRLAALFHDIGKVQTFTVKERIRFDHHASVSADLSRSILQRFQVPKNRIEKIDWLIRHHMTMETFRDLSDERKAHWYFHPWFNDLLRLFWLDIAGTTPSDFAFYESIVQDYHAFIDSHPRPPRPLITGERVMEVLGIRPGAEVGKVLQAVHDAQVRKEITTKKEAEQFVLDRFSGQ